MIPATIKQLWKGFFPQKETDPRLAYNLWADGYDNQPGNLMLDLDEAVFSDLLAEVNPLHDVADIGCGTGRHWAKIMARKPHRLVGYDVSEGMLKKLTQKFPGTQTHLLKEDNLLSLENKSCDLVCSTLTIAHIKDIGSALKEWQRVLRNNGDLIITDYHPTLLEQGGQRTFHHKGKLVAVKNYIHSLFTIRTMAAQLQLTEIRFIEKVVDESVKKYYENKQALAVYEKYKGSPVIYGIHFKKRP
jgi:ubiquinone/menaquinone biosynthesis C-methylase UbiE